MSLKIVKAGAENTLDKIFGPGKDSIEPGSHGVKAWGLRQSSLWFSNPVIDVRMIGVDHSFVLVVVYLDEDVYSAIEMAFNNESTLIEVQSTIRFEIQKLISARTAFGSVMKYFFNI